MTTKMIPITGNTYTVYKQIKALSPRAYWNKADQAWMVPEEHAEAARALVVAAPPQRRSAVLLPPPPPPKPMTARQIELEDLELQRARIDAKIVTIEDSILADAAKLKRKRASTLALSNWTCLSVENPEKRCVYVWTKDDETCLFCRLPNERK